MVSLQLLQRYPRRRAQLVADAAQGHGDARVEHVAQLHEEDALLVAAQRGQRHRDARARGACAYQGRGGQCQRTRIQKRGRDSRLPHGRTQITMTGETRGAGSPRLHSPQSCFLPQIDVPPPRRRRRAAHLRSQLRGRQGERKGGWRGGPSGVQRCPWRRSALRSELHAVVTQEAHLVGVLLLVRVRLGSGLELGLGLGLDTLTLNLTLTSRICSESSSSSLRRLRRVRLKLSAMHSSTWRAASVGCWLRLGVGWRCTGLGSGGRCTRVPRRRW